MTAIDDQGQPLVVFRLGGMGFAIPVRAVREVVPYAWLAMPPRMPSFVHGVLNLGGQAISVLRLDRLLGLAEGAFGLDSSILIMKRQDGAPVGLLVERVDGVQDGGAFQWLPMAEEQSLQGCVSHQLQGPVVQLALLSWERILLREEQQRLDDFDREVQGRLADLAEDIS